MILDRARHDDRGEEARVEQAAMLPGSSWPHDAMVAAALGDRLVHHATMITLTAELLAARTNRRQLRHAAPAGPTDGR